VRTSAYGDERCRFRCGGRGCGLKINTILVRRLCFASLHITSHTDNKKIYHSQLNNMEGAGQHKLSQEQLDHFVKHGWIKLSDCFTKEQADNLQENLWTRLGMDPNDMSTWLVHLTVQTHVIGVVNSLTNPRQAHRTHKHAFFQRVLRL
jgi:hypothetical protein